LRRIIFTQFLHLHDMKIFHHVINIFLISLIVLKRPAHVERRFKKEGSVFRDWKEDTPGSLTQAVENDFTLWKIPRFVKDDSDVSAFAFHGPF